MALRLSGERFVRQPLAVSALRRLGEPGSVVVPAFIEAKDLFGDPVRPGAFTFVK